MRIRNNLASLNTLRHTSKSHQGVQDSIERLSSGRVLNRGSDGPSVLIGAEALKNRKLGQAQATKNIEAQVNLMQSAEGGLGEVAKLLHKMKQLAVHASNEAVNDELMRKADQMEVEYLLGSLDQIAQNTTYDSANAPLLDGSRGHRGTVMGEGLRFVEAQPNTPASPPEGFEVDIQALAEPAKMFGSAPVTMDLLREPITLLVTDDNRSASFDTGEGYLGESIREITKHHEEDSELYTAETANRDLQEVLVTYLNKTLRDNGLALEAKILDDGRLMVQHQEYGDHVSFYVNASAPGLLTDEADTPTMANPGKDIKGTIGGGSANGKGKVLTARPGTPAQGAAVAYDLVPGVVEVPVLDEQGNQVGLEKFRQRPEELIGSADNPKIEGYLHLSQQSMHFQLGHKRGDHEKFSFADVRANSLGKGVDNLSRFESLADIDLTDVEGAQDAAELIDTAIDEIANLRADLGAFQKHTLERTKTGTQISSDSNLAAEAALTDTDMAAEMAEMTKHQILLQSGQSMLSQANQKPKNVLNLLRAG